MRIEALHVGMKVRHPQYGLGVVKTISEQTAEIRFDDGTHTVAPEPAGLQPADAHAEISGFSGPLKIVLQEIIQSTIDSLGIERSSSSAEEMGTRWNGGRVVLHPADPTLQTKEVPIDVFFHKIVMMRNNLRVLEQKLNGHEKLSEAEKIEMQQYITRCYGSMTTFNILFRHKEGQFGT